MSVQLIEPTQNQIIVVPCGILHVVLQRELLPWLLQQGIGVSTGEAKQLRQCDLPKILQALLGGMVGEPTGTLRGLKAYREVGSCH